MADELRRADAAGLYDEMSTTGLGFVEEPYPEAELQGFERQFRTDGFVVLPGVFVRSTVSAFRTAVQAKLRMGIEGSWDLPADAPERVAPVLAPRLRLFLPRLLSPPLPPQHGGHSASAQLFEMGWDASGAAVETAAGSWHRDRGGSALTDGGFIYPEAVHAAMYYQDMDAEPGSGATVYLSGSHLDPACPEPFESEQGGEVVEFTPRAQDVVLW